MGIVSAFSVGTPFPGKRNTGHSNAGGWLIPLPNLNSANNLYNMI